MQHVPPGQMLGTEMSLVGAFNSEDGRGYLVKFPFTALFLD